MAIFYVFYTHVRCIGMYGKKLDRHFGLRAIDLEKPQNFLEDCRSETSLDTYNIL